MAALFQRAEKDHGRLDLLANSAWSANYMAVWHKRFWDLGPAIWRETMETMRVYWLTSVHAARIMTKQDGGLIVHVTDNLHPDPSAHRGQIVHDLSHEFVNRLVMDLSETPEYIGRAAAALTADPEALKKTGQLLWACDLAKEYGFTDVDGRYIPRFDPKAPMQAFPC